MATARRLREAAPPGFEDVVRGLRRNPEIDDPYALAWEMKERGFKPFSEADGHHFSPAGLYARLLAAQDTERRQLKEADAAALAEASWFEDCPRNDKGWCEPKGSSGSSGSSGGGTASKPSRP